MAAVTAEQIEKADDDGRKTMLGGLLISLNAVDAISDEVLNQELYDEGKATWEALIEDEDWDGAAAFLATNTPTPELEGTTVGGTQTVRTDTGEDVLLGVIRDPLDVAIEDLEGADRALLGGFTKPPEDYLASDYLEWLQGISEGDKDRLAQALFVQGYYDGFNITDLDDINDPTYFANAIRGAVENAATAAEIFGPDLGLKAVPTLEEGGRFADVTQEDFEQAKLKFEQAKLKLLRDSGPTYYPTSYLKATGQQVAQQTLGRNFNRRELQQYVLMANTLLDDQSDPARLRNEQIDLPSAGVEFATSLDREGAQAKGIGDLMSTVDKVLGL